MNKEKIKQGLKYSHISQSSDDNFVYAYQYKTAFEVLFNSDKSIDRIVLPMMYCLRHYVELMLKYNIEYFSKYSGSNTMLNKLTSGHKLMPLANAFKEHWNIVSKNYKLNSQKEHMDNLYLLINKLDELDRLSMSFRYSHDKNGEKHFQKKWIEEINGMQGIDTYTFNEILNKAQITLENTMDYFDDKMGIMEAESKGIIKKYEHIILLKTKVLGASHKLVNDDLLSLSKIQDHLNHK